MNFCDKSDFRPNYLRLSVTGSCNLNCIYCAPVKPGKLDPVDQGKLARQQNDPPKIRGFRRLLIKGQSGFNGRDGLRPEEMCQLIRWFGKWGIKKVRITGGEPLMRKDITELIRMISNIETIADVSMTTNGTLLLGHLESLKSAGLKGINISLDTLNREKYREITGKDKFLDVMEAINIASNMYFRNMGINTVVLKGINDEELFDFLRLSEDRAINVRFIEFMDSAGHADFKKLHLSINAIKEQIEKRYGKLIPITGSDKLSGPARYYKIKDFKGSIGFISYRANNSCETCNRLRLTPDGYLLPCLFSKTKIDIKTPLRKHGTETCIKRSFDQACKLKSEIDGLNQGHWKTPFSLIGG